MKNKDNIKLVLEIAKWEFSRWFKLKEQFITILVAGLLSLLIFGGQAIIEKFSDKEIKIAVFNNTPIKIIMSRESNIILIDKSRQELELQRKLLNEKEISGILIIESIDSIRVLTNKKPKWLNEIQDGLTLACRQIRIEQSNISSEQLSNILKPVIPKVIYTETVKEKSGLGEKISAVIFIAVMFLGVLFGLAYQFVAITGEKQLRITEVIVSAVSPQTWIDGKILGISFLSLVLVITYLISSLVFVLISSFFGTGWSLPISLTNPGLIICLFLFSITGFFFWNTFFSAIAATINDPNTSARGSLMLVPVIPVIIAFFALGNPDSLIMKILSIFPFTSAPVISARLVLTDVSLIEIFSALILTAISIWYLRILAGKIFSLSILMYGKEPSWKEISRWFKKQDVKDGI